MNSNHFPQSVLNKYKDERFLSLIFKYLEHTISSSESEELQQCLKKDSICRDVFVALVIQSQQIKELTSNIGYCAGPLVDVLGTKNYEGFDTDFWGRMGEYEKTAPEIEIPKEKPQRELIQKVVPVSREKYKMSKFNKFTFAACAAVILFFVYLNYAHLKPYNLEVATLTDSINAKWVDGGISMQRGKRLYNNKTPLLLREGLIEIKFDNNARVTIEGPAEFQIYDEDMLKLNYGRLYSQIPLEASGFQIITQHAKIIDLGTEFGVKKQLDGDTEVHVLKGRVFFASKNINNKNVDLLAGSAGKLDVKTGELKQIPFEDNLFARQIDSKTNTVWRKETLDLADIAGKGNGFGTGKTSVIIHPTKGYTKEIELNFIIPREFKPITDNPFIDGIFVPNERSVVSTRGDVFKEAPKTSGIFSIDLVVNPNQSIFAAVIRKGAIEFNGQLYGEGGKPCISMHANIGLTFDLDAIRKYYNRPIRQFTSKVGIADLNEIVDLNEPAPCNADFYVLVDGQIRYSLRQYKQKGTLNEASIVIKDADRFLTLVTTDGGDPDTRNQNGIPPNNCDWCIFAEPLLVMDSLK